MNSYHGLKNTPEYNTWCGMKQRCNYPKNKRYGRYGARGIKVCERWDTSFLAFLEDMGNKPSPQHSLDRIDNDGDYEPSNCRWATPEEQTNNRPDVKKIAYNGRVLTMREWSKELGIKYTTIKQRLSIYKWTPDKAFNTKVRQYNKRKALHVKSGN